MLRISTHQTADLMTFQLEGKLAGPWVRELEETWQGTLVAGCKRTCRFDLSGVTFVDAAGKEFLAARYGAGDELVAAGCLMKAIVSELADSPMLVRRLGANGK